MQIFNLRKRETIAKIPIDYVKLKLNSSDWVFSQISGISSVIVDKDNHTIIKDTVQHINENDNAWSNEILKKYYQTFINGHLFLEHDQNEKKSYGLILDAKIRPVKLSNSDKEVYYVDLLVANAKKQTPNNKIAQEIAGGLRDKWSMGCQSTSIMCSKCGAISSDDENDCDHVKYNTGKSYITKYGYSSKIAMLVVDMNEGDDITQPTGKVEFIEMSSVKYPAFDGAVSSHILKVNDNTDLYFIMSVDSFNRETYNGAKYWINKKMIKVVE